MNDPVVITGTGVVSALGDSLDAFCRALLDGRSAIALMGLAIENSDSISRQLVCIDARTGATRWTRRLSDLRVPDTQSALLTGPAVLDQDVAIVLIRKEDPGRRVDGLVAVGIDAAAHEAEVLAYAMRAMIM